MNSTTTNQNQDRPVRMNLVEQGRIANLIEQAIELKRRDQRLIYGFQNAHDHYLFFGEDALAVLRLWPNAENIATGHPLVTVGARVLWQTVEKPVVALMAAGFHVALISEDPKAPSLGGY